MPRKREAYVIELAGLPGSGKTTVANLLAARLGIKRHCLVEKYNGRRYKLWIGLPLVPYTLGRFHRVFRKLVQYEIATHAGSRSALVAALVLPVAAVAKVNHGTGRRTFLSVLSVLNGLMMERTLVTLETWLRRRPAVPPVLLDGGFVQHGIAVWLRSPLELRSELWGTYLSQVPGNVLCIILRCEPGEALRRARSRPEGIPAVLRGGGPPAQDKTWLMEQYRQMSELLTSKPLTTRAKCVYVNAEMDPDKIVDSILAQVETLAPVRASGAN